MRTWFCGDCHPPCQRTVLALGALDELADGSRIEARDVDVGLTSRPKGAHCVAAPSFSVEVVESGLAEQADIGPGAPARDLEGVLCEAPAQARVRPLDPLREHGDGRGSGP